MSTNDLGPVGSSFDDWLREEGIYEEVREHAQKAVLAWQLEQAMKEHGMSISALAAKLGTSRTEIYRVLDPKNDTVSLATLMKAAAAVGKKLRVELVEDAA